MATESNWRSLASCALVPELPWIAEEHDVSEPAAVAMAAVCAQCPVFYECADYVACEGVTAGFWAGEQRMPPFLDEMGGAA
jgi:hypothetical protein